MVVVVVVANDGDVVSSVVSVEDDDADAGGTADAVWVWWPQDALTSAAINAIPTAIER